MPVVRFIQKVKKGRDLVFQRTGGCLCVLGKSSGHLEEIRSKMDNHGIKELTHLYVKLHGERKYTESMMSCFEFLQKIHPCSRTNPQTFDQVLKKQYLEFDLKYSLNECMHWMFIVRAFMFHGDSEGYTFKKFNQCLDQGLSEQEAYIVSALPSCYKYGPQGGLRSGAYPLNIAGDECLYDYRGISPERMVQIVQGEFKPKYESLTLNEHLESGTSYFRNITKLPQDKMVGTGSSWTSDCLKKIVEYTKKPKKPTVQERVSALGFSRPSQSSSVYNTFLERKRSEFNTEFPVLFIRAFNELYGGITPVSVEPSTEPSTEPKSTGEIECKT